MLLLIKWSILPWILYLHNIILYCIYISENLHSKDEYQFPHFSSTEQTFPFKRYKHLCLTAQTIIVLNLWFQGISNTTFGILLQAPYKRAAFVSQFCINLLHYHTRDKKYSVLLFSFLKSKPEHPGNRQKHRERKEYSREKEEKFCIKTNS